MFIIIFFAAMCVFGANFAQNINKDSILGAFLDYTVSFESRFYDSRAKGALDENLLRLEDKQTTAEGQAASEDPKKKFVDDDIVLIQIDDYSLQKISSWPIPRTIYATMLDKLRVFGAKVVGFDVMFPEKSPMIDGKSPDKILADSIRNFQQDERRVFFAYSLVDKKTKEGEPIDPDALPEAPVEMLNDALQTRTVPERDIFPSHIGKYTFPIQELVESEVGLASISSSEDDDGIFRQYTLISNIDSIYYGSLAFNTFEAWSGTKNTITISGDQSGELVLKGKKLEINSAGKTKIRYIGGSFRTKSLYDVVQADDNDEKMRKFFDGKLVYIGSTALGAHDLRPSPIDSKMPGVLSHMNVAHMLINQYFYQDTNDSVIYSLWLLAFSMLIVILVFRFANAFFDAAIVILVIAGSFYADRIYFLPKGFELKLFYCYFCIIACYSWHTFIQFYRANKEKKQIRGTFQRYVSPTVVDEMLKDPEHIQVGGTKMDITCLFSDVRDFTSISEGMTATELAHSLNLYMGRMTDIVFDTKGTLDKYIGDAIVALWGAPLPIGNHAQHAVEGAIKMMTVLPEINEEFKKLGRPEFLVGIGLNTGECSVGNMGSSRIFSYTALGDNMNLGARLESLCKHYGTQILISEYTLARLDKTNIRLRPIDKVIVKGKTTPVEIFEVLYPQHPLWISPDLLQTFNEAHALFLKKEFSAAKNLFEKVLSGYETDKSAKRFKEYCEKFLEHPELVKEDFEVTKMTEK